MYQTQDQQWLIAKLEKKLNLWCNHWLSRGEQLILVKVVLEAIPMYWMSLAWIPKGALESIRRLCYKFIRLGDQVKKGISLVSWKKLTIPKTQGGWGL
jgi:hypothetical protein